MDAPDGTLPGNFIRSMYHQLCQDNRKIHDDLLEEIVAEALSEPAMRVIYQKAADDFTSKPIHDSYMFVMYFPLEEIVKKAKDISEEAGRRFYFLDDNRDVIDYSDTSHIPVCGSDRPCSGGTRVKTQDRWGLFYKKHPIILSAREKLCELFPEWSVGQPHMRWYEKSGYPYVCCSLECKL